MYFFRQNTYNIKIRERVSEKNKWERMKAENRLITHRARLEAGKFCSESESSEMISVYQESISGAAVWLANGRIWKWST